jgi:hypothetical protein
MIGAAGALACCTSTAWIARAVDSASVAVGVAISGHADRSGPSDYSA